MLLGLLISRFHLKFHRESRDGVVYLLKRGSKEPLFETPQHPESRMYFGGLLGGGNGSVASGNATMDFVASKLSQSIGSLVLNRTGLTGPFDFRVEHLYDLEEHDPITIAQRTVSALGLRLEKSRGPVQTIVIDHLERPTPD